MHGVPKDLPLQRFVGDFICQICLGLNDIHFNFNKAGSINVDGGKWRLHDSFGEIVDESLDDAALPSTRQHYRVHVILDSEVTSFPIDSPDSFTLKTEMAEGESAAVIGPTRLPASRVASP